MSPFDKLIAAGIASVQTQCPSTVVCGSVTRTGVSGVSSLGVAMDATGEMTQLDGMVVLSRPDFSALGLKVNTKFTLDDELVRVVTYSLDGPSPVDVHYKKDRSG